MFRCKEKCICGYKMNSGPNKIIGCDGFFTNDYQLGFICPKCNRKYVGEQEVEFAK